jgi:hypothetical protein
MYRNPDYNQAAVKQPTYNETTAASKSKDESGQETYYNVRNELMKDSSHVMSDLAAYDDMAQKKAAKIESAYGAAKKNAYLAAYRASKSTVKEAIHASMAIVDAMTAFNGAATPVSKSDMQFLKGYFNVAEMAIGNLKKSLD